MFYAEPFEPGRYDDCFVKCKLPDFYSIFTRLPYAVPCLPLSRRGSRVVPHTDGRLNNHAYARRMVSERRLTSIRLKTASGTPSAGSSKPRLHLQDESTPHQKRNTAVGKDNRVRLSYRPVYVRDDISDNHNLSQQLIPRIQPWFPKMA